MKANELRIGNLVSAKHQDWLTPEDYEIESGSVIDLFEHEMWEVEPITLTEEWLLKFGFEKKKQGYVLDNGYLKIYYGIIGGIIELDFVSRGGYSGVVTNHIKYVHQLQNAYFALTGEELTLQENGK